GQGGGREGGGTGGGGGEGGGVQGGQQCRQCSLIGNFGRRGGRSPQPVDFLQNAYATDLMQAA
ncbi:MAG: hypothetical protein KDA44_19575, partial [Planctomycetales bacterium]|nr:hypothetical protein [Planctomycetales bacterium]